MNSYGFKVDSSGRPVEVNVPVNQLQQVPDREIIHVHTGLTCVLNDYVEEEDHHIVILTDERENGHTVSFECPPETAQVFVVGREYPVDIAIEV